MPSGAEVDRGPLEAVMHDRHSGRPWIRRTAGPRRAVSVAGIGQRPIFLRLPCALAMEAKSEPSSLSDYYNPEVSAEVAPRVFRIR